MLLIDCGNSATKCRLIVDQQCWDNTFILTQSPSLRAFRDFLKLHQPREIYLASVASDEITELVMRELSQSLPFAEITRLLTRAKLGRVKNAYQDYRRLGVDRWLTLLAAYKLASNDVVIIDAGSAITIDLLSRTSSHLGGAILPGFNTDRERFIRMFPSADFEHPDIASNDLPGRSTEACIQMSHFPVTFERINELLQDWIKLLKEPVKILLCGQDAGRISEQLERPHEVVSDLVFQGMLQQTQLQR